MNIIGGAGTKPDPYMLGGGITNRGLLNITQSLYGEFGDYNVVTNAIVFLCSQRASHITGVSLNLDGGRLKRLW